MEIKNQKYKAKSKKPEIRYLYDMRNVLYDREWAKDAQNFEVYYMYRGVKEKNGLRYNVTITPSKMLGEEFAKTKGHYHRGGCQELYIVLEGRAIFLLQKEKGGLIENVYFVKAKRGESVLIPPQYGHIAINPFSKTLKTGDWSTKGCKSVYESIEKKRGACYYYTKRGWIKNKNYKRIPKLRFKKPLKSIPKDLSFLLK